MHASEGKTVKITLNVGGNNNGSRVNVTPPDVAFEQNDKIVVASNGKYVGTLTHNGNVFEGEITGATENQPLYFYFLGNKDLQYTMDGDNIVGCTLNISDQSAELPVLSYAASNEVYTTSTTSFTAALDNQCALVKFTYDFGTEGNTSKYNRADGLTTLDSGDDAATVLWGADWRMPTQEEWEELLNNTTHTKTTQGGVLGRLFTATNGNSLFLPAAGYYQYGSLDFAGRDGEYWSNSLKTDYQNTSEYGNGAIYFYLSTRDEGSCDMSYTRRCYGLSVRAVRAN